MRGGGVAGALCRGARVAVGSVARAVPGLWGQLQEAARGRLRDSHSVSRHNPFPFWETNNSEETDTHTNTRFLRILGVRSPSPTGKLPPPSRPGNMHRQIDCALSFAHSNTHSSLHTQAHRLCTHIGACTSQHPQCTLTL